MSSSVNVSLEKDGDTGVLNLEITEEAEGDQVIVLSNIFELFALDYYMPGDIQNMKVNIVNRSGHSYQYKDSSFVLVPPDVDKTFGSLEDGALLPILGFDGQYLPLRSVGAMLPKYFYKILGASKETEVTFEQMCSVLDVLKENEYDSIAKYLADFYNYDSWEAMASDMENLGNTLFSSRYTHNGIYNVTEDQLNAMVEKYDWLDQYLYVTVKSDDTLQAQIKWPDADVAALTYNYFYMRLLFFAYGAENVAQLEPNGQLNEFTFAHAFANYQPGQASYEEVNNYFANLLGDFTNESAVSFDMAFALNGPEMNNIYQLYSAGLYNAIVLEQVDGNVTISKVDPDGNAVSGAEFVVGRVVDGQTQYLGYEGEWTADQQAAAVYVSQNGSFVIKNLPFGEYFLKEITAPEGYVLSEETVAFTVDETAEAVQVVNEPEEEEIPDESTPLNPPESSEPSGGEEIPDESTPLNPPDEDIPDESTPLAPATGENSGSPVWIVVGMAMAGCCAAAVVLCRKKETEKAHK